MEQERHKNKTVTKLNKTTPPLKYLNDINIFTTNKKEIGKPKTNR